MAFESLLCDCCKEPMELKTCCHNGQENRYLVGYQCLKCGCSKFTFLKLS